MPPPGGSHGGGGGHGGHRGGHPGGHPAGPRSAHSRHNKPNGHNYHEPHGSTKETLYAGLISIFVVAVVLFIGISVALTGRRKCCQKYCKCCRHRRRHRHDDERGTALDNIGHHNTTFSDSPPTYQEIFEQDAMSTTNSRPNSMASDNIFIISDPAVRGPGSNTNSCNILIADNHSNNFSTRLGNPPNYFETVGSSCWTSSAIGLTSSKEPDVPPPKYTDVEKEIEEERQTHTEGERQTHTEGERQTHTEGERQTHTEEERQTHTDK